ncbi:MAG: D-2-hydroxyacid dehydrogenase [Planctomycetaceae bacterium]|nr:D-2-hydroxyacid dehydrogenase [Planctomycetales bacterium]MCB9927325.1 D-2-hydroxyacid dehydrogenase [Planctomycetaceae bacterium]
MKLVVYPAVEPARLSRIEDAAGAMVVANVEDESAAVEAIRGADAFFGKLTPAMLTAAQKLRWVQSPTASLEHYVFPELVSHPCTLTNMRGLFSDVIADHVLGYILCFARNLHMYLRQQIARRWEPIGGEQARTSFAAGPGVVSAMDRAHMHLSDGTVGIVGLGAIGAEVAKRAKAFGMRVLAVDPLRTDKPETVDALWQLNQLPQLLGQSDFVVIAAPHTPQTSGMFDRRVIQQMKQTGYLINIGRGVIVKLDDLCGALSAGEIAGAALDVFEQEPLPEDHPLWNFENVVITPHVAACSVHIAERHLEVLLTNIRRFVNREPLANVVSKENWF